VIIDTNVLKDLLKANKLFYNDSENLKKFEETIEIIEYVWLQIQNENSTESTS
jgi:hypothetical protein